MRGKTALSRMMVLAAFIYVFCGPSPCEAAKLTDSQIQTIQANIKNSTDLSTKCLELHNNADQNSTIASSNYQKTSIQGFRQAAAMYGEANSKFLEARKLFDDASIKMQFGMEDGDLNHVDKGILIHNTGVNLFKEGLQLLNSAAEIFKRASSESKSPESRSRSGPTSSIPSGNVRTPPNDMAPNRMTPSFPPANIPQNDFPIVALIILLSTAFTSVRALKNKVVYQRYILHPWSIVRHKTRYYTLISYGLIHINSMHLLKNLLSFSLFALPLEGIIGHLRFVLVYFGSLIFSSVIVTMEHGDNARYSCVGASGAIVGVIFSYIIQHPYLKIGMVIVPMGVPATLYALSFLAHSYSMSRKKSDNVAHDAHMCGAIAGAFITFILDPTVVGIVTNIFH